MVPAVNVAAPVGVRGFELSGVDRRVGDFVGEFVFVVVTLHDRLVGTVVVERSVAADPSRLAERCARVLAGPLDAHLLADVPAGVEPLCARRREWVDERGPAVTVVVATRGRPELLGRALESIEACSYRRRRVVVVDNDPPDDATARLVGERFPGVGYVVEGRRGLANARNRGLAEVGTPVVAFTDDDVVVDRWWLTEMAAAFLDDPGLSALTGAILPDQLDTPAQVHLELHGDYAKGFQRRVFDLAGNRPDDRLFPFNIGWLGSGCNMAFSTAWLVGAGGFDPALGTGTRARGGEDLAILFEAVATGGRVCYEPAAFVRHRHRADMESLSRQSFAYGVGCGAYLASVAHRHPRLLLQAARVLPSGVRHGFGRRADRNGYDGWPPALVWGKRAGLLLGPAAYALSRLDARRPAP